jgi:hypothetical protein
VTIGFDTHFDDVGGGGGSCRTLRPIATNRRVIDRVLGLRAVDGDDENPVPCSTSTVVAPIAHQLIVAVPDPLSYVTACATLSPERATGVLRR